MKIEMSIKISEVKQRFHHGDSVEMQLGKLECMLVVTHVESEEIIREANGFSLACITSWMYDLTGRAVDRLLIVKDEGLLSETSGDLL